jgi:Trypsin-co-occurring domain 2
VTLPQFDGDARWVGLAEAVAALRDELISVKDTGLDHPVGLRVGPVEVEFAAVVRRGSGGRFGLTFGVLTGGAEGTAGHEQAHRVKVTLTPFDAVTREELDIADSYDTIPSQ